MTLAVSGTLNSNHSLTHKSQRFIFKTQALSRDKSAKQYARAHLRGLISSKCLYPRTSHHVTDDISTRQDLLHLGTWKVF